MKSDHENSTRQSFERNTARERAIKTAENSHTPIKRTTPTILFTGRKRLRFSFRGLIMPLICLLLSYLLLSFYAERLLSTRFRELAAQQAQKHLFETVNDTVEEMANEGLLHYGDMVSTIRDEAGEVIYLEVDTAMLAKAKSRLVRAVDQALEEKRRITLSVPMGSLGGWNLFSGLGFPVWVKIYPIGMTQGEIYTELEDCGINQTRHLIQINVEAKMHLVLPDGGVDVETKLTLPLGERVLVGEVPEIYLDTLGVN